MECVPTVFDACIQQLENPHNNTVIVMSACCSLRTNQKHIGYWQSLLFSEMAATQHGVEYPPFVECTNIIQYIFN